MRQSDLDLIKRRLFKKLGVAFGLARNPIDMSVLWKREKHRTFRYNPDCHSYIKESGSDDKAGVTAVSINILRLIRVKGPVEIKQAYDAIDQTFSKVENISSLMAIDYQTDKFERQFGTIET